MPITRMLKTSSRQAIMQEDVAAFLVGGHLVHLWAAVQDEIGGCCNDCCGSCWALKQLLDSGELDDLYRVYVNLTGGPDNDSIWDTANDQVDRGLLTQAWSVDLGCREDHDTPA
jgi:hypothetical protein